MPSVESDYLKELINDFPCDPKIDVSQAEILLQERYKILGYKFIPEVIAILNKPLKINLTSEPHLNPLIDILYEGDKFPYVLFETSKIVHKHLFNKILSNAGEFRKATDPGNGFIGFGGFNKRIIGNFHLQGTSPNHIIDELYETFSFLRKDTDDPIRAGLLFYRKYVRTHPYYDGNGRIGRLILSIYLRAFRLEIQWDKILKEKFINKINKCHIRENKQAEFEKYFSYFYNFMKKAIEPMEEDDIS